MLQNALEKNLRGRLEEKAQLSSMLLLAFIEFRWLPNGTKNLNLYFIELSLTSLSLYQLTTEKTGSLSPHLSSWPDNLQFNRFLSPSSQFLLPPQVRRLKLRKSGSDCASSCGIGKAANVVPYPFGFSNGCPIQLNCNSTEGKIKIDEFQVQSITPNGVLINLPADCSRSIETIKPLFGQNYGPSLSNSLLLQNCSKPINGCVISRSPLQRELHSKNCEAAKNDSLNCYTQTYSDIDTLSYAKSLKELNWNGGLKVPVRIIVIDAQTMGIVVTLSSRMGVLDSGVSAMMGSLEMGLTPGMAVGETAWCERPSALSPYFHILSKQNDGRIHLLYIFRVSKCNASRYMSGKCGGTTRVVVLVGGIIVGASLMAALSLLCYFVRQKSTSMRNRSSAKAPSM
ncbi:WALL-ASSOCIATED RECEPTOR KINASE-LIKE 21 [Salix viminalis]|uniref:WALL-ASSOCIATED RECEPTOR KINASE-LIKE 21 n=1 Tax=Salix viminalis TaxID=40686 RepID=A0A9Q0ZJE6_SALVM|nr:WALL-ASSOCIATED RECEPTOR KINASE-LIKE 21 [Salix viminalis]